ncbi:UMP kinase [Candidatus Nanosynbacter lyticus]|uniref:UMP kinase n=1 Tax=Candidatus Nanosynbacter lyticus TaxID=2093824 RepID=UPI0038D15893
MTKRILLKLSGEQLQGDFSSGFDPKRAKWIAEQIRPAIEDGAEIIIMVGGGNYVRGNQIIGHGIQPVSAHNIGMLSTLMNAIALTDVFNDSNLPTRALSTVEINQFIDQYTFRRAISHIQKGRVVIVACGTGRPFLTTDTAALNLALEMQCNAVIKTTKVDGVYDKDPTKFSNATKFDQISYHDVLTNPDITVMDKAAIGLAMEEHIPVIICDLLIDSNIARAARGEAVGTIIN